MSTRKLDSYFHTPEDLQEQKLVDPVTSPLILQLARERDMWMKLTFYLMGAVTLALGGFVYEVFK